MFGSKENSLYRVCFRLELGFGLYFPLFGSILEKLERKGEGIGGEREALFLLKRRFLILGKCFQSKRNEF